MSYVTYVAVEGLGNRLRTHFIAYAYALHTHRKLIVNWSKVKAFGVRFSDLFELTDFSELTPFSLYGPLMRLYQEYSMQRFNGKVLNDSQTIKDLPATSARLVVFGEAFYPWAYERKGAVLGEYCNTVLNSLKPLPEILEKVRNLRTRFASKTVGVHIRRGDFYISFPDKIISIDNYITIANNIVEINPGVKFFVSTDDMDESKPFIEKFDCIVQEKGPRETNKDIIKVFGYNNKCNRDTKRGAMEAVVDMYLLSATNLIVGSEISSFSKMASFIGKTKLIIPNKLFLNTVDKTSLLLQ